MGGIARRGSLRLGLTASVLLSAGCSEEAADDVGGGILVLLLIFLLVVLVVVAAVIALVTVGVSFLGKGVDRMTRRAPPPTGPWWDPVGQVWRAPDGSSFDPTAQRWVPPAPGTLPAPSVVTGVAEADRQGGAVMVGIGGGILVLVAAFVIDGPAQSLLVVGGVAGTALLIHQLWQRGEPSGASTATPAAPTATALPSPPPPPAPRRRRPLRAEASGRDEGTGDPSSHRT